MWDGSSPKTALSYPNSGRVRRDRQISGNQRWDLWLTALPLLTCSSHMEISKLNVKVGIVRQCMYSTAKCLQSRHGGMQACVCYTLGQGSAAAFLTPFPFRIKTISRDGRSLCSRNRDNVILFRSPDLLNVARSIADMEWA